jgi:hypothetical protein
MTQKERNQKEEVSAAGLHCMAVSSLVGLQGCKGGDMISRLLLQAKSSVSWKGLSVVHTNVVRCTPAMDSAWVTLFVEPCSGAVAPSNRC